MANLKRTLDVKEVIKGRMCDEWWRYYVANLKHTLCDSMEWRWTAVDSCAALLPEQPDVLVPAPHQQTTHFP